MLLLIDFQPTYSLYESVIKVLSIPGQLDLLQLWNFLHVYGL